MHSSVPTMSASLPRVEETHVLPTVSNPQAAMPYFTWREITIFGSIVSSILLAINALVCATWSYFFGKAGWVAWQALPGALAIVFIPATILRFRSAHPPAYTIPAATWPRRRSRLCSVLAQASATSMPLMTKCLRKKS